MDSSENSTSDNDHNNNNNNSIINIYPINHYYFGSKEAALSIKHDTVSERFHRLKSNYAQLGMRINVEAVLLVELSSRPHLLVLQVNNSVIKLPGGRLRHGESDVAGLQRKLSTKISDGDVYWKVGECLGTWWRSDFDTWFHRNPITAQSAKECTKLFIVHLPEYQRFTVPKYQKLIAVPLRILHDNRKTYGSIVSEIPQLLSKFTINPVYDS